MRMFPAGAEDYLKRHLPTPQILGYRKVDLVVLCQAWLVAISLYQRIL